jgi:hypothetical protein
MLHIYSACSRAFKRLTDSKNLRLEIVEQHNQTTIQCILASISRGGSMSYGEIDNVPKFNRTHSTGYLILPTMDSSQHPPKPQFVRDLGEDHHRIVTVVRLWHAPVWGSPTVTYFEHEASHN